MVCLSETIPDFSGQVIDNGRYHLINMIGSGAYGCVYRALDTTSDAANPQYYAVKCLSKADLTPDQSMYQRRETIVHKMVSGSSPNVLTLHEIIEEDLYLYFVLDLITGGDLFNAIIKDRIYHNNVPLLKQAFIELLDGVHACHQRGVFHRDLKPENILCRGDGAGLIVADFGLATRKRVCKDFGCGSSYYMSPECLCRELKYPHYSPLHTDIWSLGIILVNMVSGRNPWRLATTSDNGFLSYLHDPEYLREVLPISRPFNDILKRIFLLNPLSRISLPELREEILKLDTFYMSEGEIRHASLNVRDAAIGYAKRAPITKLVLHQVATDVTLVNDNDSDSDSDSSDDFPRPNWTYDSAEHITALAESAEPPPRSYGAEVSVRLVGRSERIGDFIIGSDSGSSIADSEGPITPETHADDLATDVPDLPEGETLDQAIVAIDIVANTNAKQTPQLPPSILRSAVQRFRAF